MKKLKKHNDGFTLMELLVGINISFIVITMLVSVYLFLFKFMISTSRNMDAKLNVTSGLQTIVSELYKSESFDLKIEGDFAAVVTKDNRVILFEQDSIKINEICVLADVESYEINVKLKNGDSKLFVNGQMDNEKMFAEVMEEMPSDIIRAFELAVKYNDKIYRAEYLIPQISANMFTNITRQ